MTQSREASKRKDGVGAARGEVEAEVPVACTDVEHVAEEDAKVEDAATKTEIGSKAENDLSTAELHGCGIPDPSINKTIKQYKGQVSVLTNEDGSCC